MLIRLGSLLSRKPASGGSTTLNDGLVAFWKLDEASGTRADSVGSNDLTDNNTVGQATGKIGNAAGIDPANSEFLSADSDDARRGATSYTWAGWVYLNSLDNDTLYSLVSLYETNAAREYIVWFDHAAEAPTDRFKFRVYQPVSDNGNTHATAAATSFGEPSIETWIFIHAYYDADNEEAGISINNGDVDTGAGTGNPPAEQAGALLELGGRNGSLFLDGRMDAWGLWGRLLTAAEVTELWNDGNGKEYPF